jgi:hypothetical protein
MNDCGNTAVLVDKRLGNSYETVKMVAESLTEILYVAANLSNLVPKDIELQESADKSFLQWRYAGSATWTNLVPLVDLPQAEFQVTGDFVLQWRYQGAATWTDLTSLNNFFAQVVVAPGVSKIPRAGTDSMLDTGWLKLEEINQAPNQAAATAQETADAAKTEADNNALALTAAQETITTLQADLADTQTQLTAANAALVALTARVAVLEAAP